MFVSVGMLTFSFLHISTTGAMYKRKSTFYTGTDVVPLSGSSPQPADVVTTCMRQCIHSTSSCAVFAFSSSLYECVLFNDTEAVHFVSGSSSTVWQVYHMLPGCPPSWTEFNDACYLFYGDVHVQWSEAKVLCENQGAQLVELESDSESNFLISVVESINASSKVLSMITYGWWIGGNDIDIEGTWRWAGSNKIISGYNNWFQGEPNDPTGDEDCMMIMYIAPRYGWVDITCTVHRNFVCKRLKAL